MSPTPSEITPLLPERASTPGSPDIGGESSLSSSTNTQEVRWPEAEGRHRPLGGIALDFRLFWPLLLDSIPVILSYVLQNSIQTSSILIVGRLGPDELSVAAFSLMFAFVTGWCVALGGTTALDTIGSQAFTGGHPEDLSIHFQRCLVILWALFVPVGVLWTFSESLLLFLGQPPVLSHEVQKFLRILLWGAPGYIGFESLKKYLQCQGIMSASTVVLVALFPVNLVLNIFLVHWTPLGLLGSPVALSFTYWLLFIGLGVWTYLSPTHKSNATWAGIQIRHVFNPRSCVVFLKLAIPGILMVGTEWAAFEIVALAAALLGPIPLAAQSVIMTTDQILNTVPFGIGIAASARVGNLIGSQEPVAAKRAAHASAFLSIFVGIVVMAIMILTKDVFGLLFSDDENVVTLVAKVMPLVASFQVADGLAGSCGGVLRGQGRQHVGALFNVVAYYVIALPLGITLAFWFKMGLEGLWIGQVVALFIVGISEYCMVWLGTDWESEVQKGLARNREEHKLRNGE